MTDEKKDEAAVDQDGEKISVGELFARLLAEPDTRTRYDLPIYGDLYSDKGAGKFVAIRPCDPECENKTFLGIYIGEIAVGACFSIMKAEHQEPKGNIDARIEVRPNPAIWVPALKRVVFGLESWWGAIKSIEDLTQITDDDIANTWYVKAAREMMAKEAAPIPPASQPS